MDKSNDKLNKLVPLKNSLKQTYKFEEISNKLLQYIQQIPNLLQEKNNIELVNLMANVIEYLCKKKYKLNKENLLVFTLKKALQDNLTEEDEQNIKKHIEYLHSNNLIKSVSKLSFVKGLISNFFLKGQ